MTPPPALPAWSWWNRVKPERWNSSSRSLPTVSTQIFVIAMMSEWKVDTIARNSSILFLIERAFIKAIRASLMEGYCPVGWRRGSAQIEMQFSFSSTIIKADAPSPLAGALGRTGRTTSLWTTLPLSRFSGWVWRTWPTTSSPCNRRRRDRCIRACGGLL